MKFLKDPRAHTAVKHAVDIHTRYTARLTHVIYTEKLTHIRYPERLIHTRYTERLTYTKYTEKLTTNPELYVSMGISQD